ncbi:MAG: cation diffusion facilitator family transporter, partial [Candidatus Solibacter sp.]|nr:cation diffusion facilitator family transporter [Candidatus Solibacter sp.]
MQIGQRVAVAGMLVSGALALIKIVAGLAGHSTAVVADGLESAADVIASGFVLFGLTMAAKPADDDHPYGHGRIETLTGLVIGFVLTAGGALISWSSLRRVGQPHETLEAFVIGPLVLSLFAKMGLASMKFRYGRTLNSSALTADAWNDAMDCISAVAALIAVGLTLKDPVRFAEADRYGGFVVGLIEIAAGIRVSRETAIQLMDTMPGEPLIAQIRAAAMSVPGVLGVEKCYARKTGLKYHV